MKDFKILILAAILLVPAMPWTMAMSGTGFINETLVGKPAADFTLETVKGNKVNLTKYRDGKKAIVFFWATWCPHCREELKHLNELQKEINDKGIKIVLISLGEEKTTVVEYLERHHYDYEVLLDENQTLEGPYQLVGVPTLFFIDEKGVIKLVDHAFPSNYEEVFK